MEASTNVALAAAAPEADALYRKVALRLLPFLFLCYVVNYIDRANIGFAKLQFTQDLGFSDAVYGLGAGVFYIGYVLFEIPSNMYLQRVGARATLLRILLLWGVVSGLTALVKTPGQLYLARFLLGVAEAGFFPGVILYLTYWFPSARRARVTSILVTALVVAGMLGGLVSGWIMKEATGLWGMKGWQALFVLEAIPAVVLGLLVYWALDDRPDAVKWLSEREKAIIRQDLQADGQRKAVAARHQGLYASFKDVRVYVAALVYSAIGAASAAISLWMPTLIKSAHVSDLKTVGYLAMLPYLCAAIGMFLVGRSSDRFLERRWHVAGAAVVGAAAFLALGIPGLSLIAMMALLCVASAGTYGAITVFWTIPPAYLKGPGAAAGIALISSIGAGLGGFGGAALVGAIKAATGSLYWGLAAVAIAMIVAAVLLLIAVPARLLREN